MVTTSRIRLTALLALTALCLFPLYAGDARADHWEDHLDFVYDELKSDHEDYEDRGYTFVHYIMGKLDEDGEDAWTFRLSSRTTYVVAGRCDEDCTDLDLRLKTSSGTIVDSDVLIDVHPDVSVRPTRSRDYTVEVVMFSCLLEPCYYGIALFAR